MRRKNPNKPTQRTRAKPEVITDAPTVAIIEPTPVPISESRTMNLWNDGFGHLATRSAQGLLVLTGVALVIYGMTTLSVVVIPILIATILASALQPAVSFLERKRIPRVVATIITLLTGAIAFLGLGTLVVSGVRHEWGTLTNEVNKGIKEVATFLTSGNLPINQKKLDELLASATDFFTSAQFGSGALAGLGSAFTVLTGFVLTIVILFFFVKDGPAIWRFLISPFHPTIRTKLERVGENSVNVLGGYITGTTVVALVDALLIGVALSILHVPLALPLALIVFVGAFIPIVGATLAGTVAALVALVTNDLNAAIIVVIVVIAVNQLEGNFLAPVVLGNALKLHALVILLALSIGTILGGIIGTLLAVPIAAVLWAAVKAWRAESGPLWNEPDKQLK